jgi:hypothetical protein
MRGFIAGSVAGAAGTMALDITSYLDMALRGRAPSETPAEVIRRLAAKAGNTSLAVPSDEADAATKNRRSALGALGGYAIGIGLGALYGSIASDRQKVTVAALALAALAMAASDVPATLLEATTPTAWGAGGWISDIVPHAAYGLVTAAAFAAIARPQA